MSGAAEVSGRHGLEYTTLFDPGVSLDLDVDTDNNGYINTEANKPRMKWEETNEAQIGKPITYFGPNSPHPEFPSSARYIPLRLTASSELTNGMFSLDWTANLQVEWDEWMLVSGQKYPLSQGEGEDAVLWVMATGATGAAQVNARFWENESAAEPLLVDTVLFAIQDNASHLTDWVIPNEWTIDDETAKTPMPVDGNALGPQKEWTGNNYNRYNKGDAYTKAPISGAFTLAFDVEFDQRLVQPDNGSPYEYTPDGDSRKLGFVANSGIKIGPRVEDPLTDTDTRPEVAILDVVKWVNLAPGGITYFNQESAWNGACPRVAYALGQYYANEPLNKLMSAVVYGGDYAKMADAGHQQPTDWQDYYQILASNYSRMNSFATYENNEYVGSSFRMRVSYSGNSLVVQLAACGTTDWSSVEEVYRDDAFVAPAGSYLSLQSHWGSGVRFSNIMLQ